MVVNETSVPGSFPVPNGFPTCGNFNNIKNPINPVTGSLVVESDYIHYRNSTIGLAVVSFFLLVSFLATLIVCLALLCTKKRKTAKFEIEMK